MTTKTLSRIHGGVIRNTFKVENFKKKMLITTHDIFELFDLDDPTFFENLIRDNTKIVFDFENFMVLLNKADYNFFNKQKNNLDKLHISFISTYPTTDLLISESLYNYIYEGLDSNDPSEIGDFEYITHKLQAAIKNEKSFFMGFPILYNIINSKTYVITIADTLE